ARRPPLQRLAGQTTSEIRDVDDKGVWLYSSSMERTYQIRRDMLAEAWETLLEKGMLVPRDVRMHYGAVTLLAHRPYGEYSAEPGTLSYPASAPHPLGTVRRGDEDE